MPNLTVVAQKVVTLLPSNLKMSRIQFLDLPGTATLGLELPVLEVTQVLSPGQTLEILLQPGPMTIGTVTGPSLRTIGIVSG